MKRTLLIIIGLIVSFGFGFYLNSLITKNEESIITQPSLNINNEKIGNMNLGAFSISLTVKDICKSKDFYEKLGFTYMGGDIDKNWIVLKNGNAVIGLFQGMFEDNLLTFNPGWDSNAQNLEGFEDVRNIQKQLKNSGIALTREADETTTGPEYITLTDPDGNSILIDQHR